MGIPFHAIIRGIAPFTLLKLHGIPWHSDPSYFKYSDGWTYDPKTRTLALKITGRADQETIDISTEHRAVRGSQAGFLARRPRPFSSSWYKEYTEFSKARLTRSFSRAKGIVPSNRIGAPTRIFPALRWTATGRNCTAFIVVW